MINSSPHNSNFLHLLKDPNTTLDDIISSKDFFSYWSKSEPSLNSFIIKHYDELIETGFQIKHESANSIRYLQLMSSTNSNFQHHLFTKTKFLQFVYDYLFNLSSYPIYSQKNYFYVLPNIMIDKLDILHSKFDAKYFTQLFKSMDNDFAFNFILRIIEFAPRTISKILNQINIDEIIISNLLTYNSIENKNYLLLIRNQVLFKTLVTSKFEGDLSTILQKHMKQLIENAINNPDSNAFSFLHYLDEVSTSKTILSKWHKIHLDLIPYLSTFCNIVLNSKTQTFTPLSESCVLLSLSIVSSKKDIPDCFIDLFKYLLNIFFILTTNTFLHNCVVKVFKFLVSVDKINSKFLDEFDLFNKITKYYEDKTFCPFKGQLRLISDEMNRFASSSKTVDLEKWNKFVVKRNAKSHKIINGNFGGNIPFDYNGIKRFISKKMYYDPSFAAKNLQNENKQPKKVKINNPLY